MNRKRALNIVLSAVVIGSVVFIVSFSMQMLSAREFQAGGWNICPGYISAIFNSALAHGAVTAAFFSAVLVLLRRRNGEAAHVDPSA